MNTDDKRIWDCLKRIRVRVDNWAQGKGYGPSGWGKDAAERDVVFLLNHIADLQVEAREKNAWEGRYWALLEECEASRPPEIDYGGCALPQGSIAIDADGLAWGRTLWGWSILRPDFRSRTKLLAPENGPYAITYTPKEES